MSCPSCQVSGRRLPGLKASHALRCSALGSHEIGGGMVSDKNVEPVKIQEFVYKEDGVCANGCSQRKFCEFRDEWKILGSLTNEVHLESQKLAMMNELAVSVSGAIHANTFSLYVLDSSGQNLCKYAASYDSGQLSFSQSLSLKDSGTIAGYVARKREVVFCTDFLQDERFPNGIGQEGTAQSVICHPIYQSSGDILGVVEFLKDAGAKPFASEDVEIASSFLAWGSLAVCFAEKAQELTYHAHLQNFITHFLRSLTSANEDVSELLHGIMKFAKEAIDFDQYGVFLHDDKAEELYSVLLATRTGNGMDNGKPDLKDIRVPTASSVPGYVLRTGDIVNIKDAYADNRFNRSIDQMTGHLTKSILCCPIHCNNKVFGAIQLSNSCRGMFTESDEKALLICGACASVAFQVCSYRNVEKKGIAEVQVLQDMLIYHSRPCQDRIRDVACPAHPTELPSDIASFSFNYFENKEHFGYWIYVLSKDVLDRCCVKFNDIKLISFLATVERFYREQPYHNWEHAFSVAQFMYAILLHVWDKFTELEILALFFGCLCHDLDHRARNNNFMKVTENPIAKLYPSSTMERHHYYLAQFILKQEQYNFIQCLSYDSRLKLMSLMEEAILATDLLLYFGNKDRLAAVVRINAFDWKCANHRLYLSRLMMTACDLCAVCKPWDVQRKSAAKVHEEFLAQGLEEQSLGMKPLVMMTGENHLPANQIGFINGVVAPCIEMLVAVIPQMKPAMDQLIENLHHWEDIVQSKDTIAELRVPGSALQERSLSFVKYEASSKSLMSIV